jgi:hypothetical protein
MLNLALAKEIGMTQEEIDILACHRTPEEFQEFLKQFPYNMQDYDKETYWSFRKALREGKFDCFSGAMTGAAYILMNNLGPPLIVCIEAMDVDHNLAAYWRDGKVGSIAASRDPNLTGKPPQFKSYTELAMSYYPFYYNEFTQDKSDISMRGLSMPIDLRVFGYRWITAEENMDEIEKYLYEITYTMLFPGKPGIYEWPPIVKTGNNTYRCPKLSPQDMQEALKQINT